MVIVSKLEEVEDTKDALKTPNLGVLARCPFRLREYEQGSKGKATTNYYLTLRWFSSNIVQFLSAENIGFPSR